MVFLYICFVVLKWTVTASPIPLSGPGVFGE